MKMFNFKNVLALFVVVVLIFSVGITTSVAQEKTKVAGKDTYATVRSENFDVGDVEGHNIGVVQQEGVFESKSDLFNGAQTFYILTYDQVNGNGPYQGCGKMTKNGDTVSIKFEGVVTTSPSDKGPSVPTWQGTFSYQKGTGQFENIQGGGTFKGRPISRIIFVNESEGEYWFKK
jgi:hypothetical protein